MAVPNIRVPLAFGAVVTGGQPNLRTPFVFAEPLTGGEANVRASYLFAEPLTGGNPNLRVAFAFVEALIPVPEELPVATLVFPPLRGAWGRKKNEGYNTGVRPNTSGREVRNAFQDDPVWTFELTYQLLRDDNVSNGYTVSDLRAIRGLFKACKGKYTAFLYRDPDDYRVTSGAIATADGVTLQWPFPWKDGEAIAEDGTVTGQYEPVGQIDLTRLAAFASTAVNTSTDAINVTGHGLVTGQGPLWVDNVGGALPTGLVAATPYWAIAVDADHFKLASTLANAMGGTAVNITAQGSGTDHVTKGVAVYDNGALLGPSDWSLTLPNQLVFASAPTAGHAITADFDYWYVCRFVDDATDASQFASKLWDLQKLDFVSVIQ
jgi:hypothetical protein